MSAPDELVLASLVLLIAAPVAGVLVHDRRRLAVALLAAVAASAAVHGVLHHAPAVPLAEAHLVLLAAMSALAAVGAACGAWFADSLDAIGAALLIALAVTVGLFAAGPAAGLLPTSAMNAALAANPVVAVSSALNVDILRGPLLYRLSPIAHRQFSYPTWWYSGTVYAGTAAAVLLLKRNA